MNYWPGTTIIKSKGNAFNWQGSVSQIAAHKSFKQSQSSALINAGNGTDVKKQFTIYSKAQAKK